MNNLKHKSATFVVYNTKSVVFTTLMAGIQTLSASCKNKKWRKENEDVQSFNFIRNYFNCVRL